MLHLQLGSKALAEYMIWYSNNSSLYPHLATAGLEKMTFDFMDWALTVCWIPESYVQGHSLARRCCIIQGNIAEPKVRPVMVALQAQAS